MEKIAQNYSSGSYNSKGDNRGETAQDGNQGVPKLCEQLPLPDERPELAILNTLPIMQHLTPGFAHFVNSFTDEMLLSHMGNKQMDTHPTLPSHVRYLHIIREVWLKALNDVQRKSWEASPVKKTYLALAANSADTFDTMLTRETERCNYEASEAFRQAKEREREFSDFIHQYEGQIFQTTTRLLVSVDYSDSVTSGHALQLFKVFLGLDGFAAALIACDRQKARVLLRQVLNYNPFQSRDFLHQMLQRMLPQSATESDFSAILDLVMATTTSDEWGATSGGKAELASSSKKGFSDSATDEVAMDYKSLAFYPMTVLERLLTPHEEDGDGGGGDVAPNILFQLRQDALDSGVMDFVLDCLALFTHQHSRFRSLRSWRMPLAKFTVTLSSSASSSSSDANNKKQEQRPKTTVLNPKAALLEDDLIDFYSDQVTSGGGKLSAATKPKWKGGFAKGTGYGGGAHSSAGASHWNAGEHQKRTSYDDVNVACLLKILHSYIYPLILASTQQSLPAKTSPSMTTTKPRTFSLSTPALPSTTKTTTSQKMEVDAKGPESSSSNKLIELPSSSGASKNAAKRAKFSPSLTPKLAKEENKNSSEKRGAGATPECGVVEQLREAMNSAFSSGGGMKRKERKSFSSSSLIKSIPSSLDEGSIGTPSWDRGAMLFLPADFITLIYRSCLRNTLHSVIRTDSLLAILENYEAFVVALQLIAVLAQARVPLDFQTFVRRHALDLRIERALEGGQGVEDEEEKEGKSDSGDFESSQMMVISLFDVVFSDDEGEFERPKVVELLRRLSTNIADYLDTVYADQRQRREDEKQKPETKAGKRGKSSSVKNKKKGADSTTKNDIIILKDEESDGEDGKGEGTGKKKSSEKEGKGLKEEDEEQRKLSALFDTVALTVAIVESTTELETFGKAGKMGTTEDNNKMDTEEAAASEVSAAADNQQKIVVDEKEYVQQMQPLQFDTISLDADVNFHYRAELSGSELAQSARLRRIAKEIFSLRSSLILSPSSSAFVRTFEQHMDGLKVLITGPDDTPYAGGCFVFDVFFPGEFPAKPPQVHFNTTGGGAVRFNPNLYNCGKVCLSILGTWAGSPEEMWNAQRSTLLQVITSIQSLIFVEQPYFNEPGFQSTIGTEGGDAASRTYNREIRLHTVHYAMLEQLRSPEAPFGEIIRRHFRLKRAQIESQVERWLAEDQKLQKHVEALKKELQGLHHGGEPEVETIKK